LGFKEAVERSFHLQAVSALRVRRSLLRVIGLKIPNVFLASVMVSMLAIGHKVRGFIPGQGNGFLREIQIRSKPSF
jgi:hypothetical protein